MNKLYSMPIRKQIFVLLLIMSIVPFGLVAYSGLSQRNHEIAEAIEFTNRATTQIKNDMRHQLDSIEQLAATLSILPDIRKRNTPAVNQLLAEVVRNSNKFSNISIADRSGIMWASAVPVQPGLSLSDRRYFQQAVSSGLLSSGEYTISRTQNIPVFSFAHPVIDQTGTVSDVLIFTFSLENYRRFLAEYANSSISSIALIDHRGIVLYSTTSNDRMGKQDKPDLFKQMIDGPELGNFEGQGFRGTHRFFSYAKLRLEGEIVPYMYIRTGLSKDGVLREVNRDLFTSIAVLALAMLASLAVVLLVCKRGIYDKIVAIRLGTRKIANGEYEARIGDAVVGGELGELASAFDSMAEKLQSDSLELKQACQAQKESESKYRELVENANSIILKWDREGRVTYLNEFGERFFGFSQQELIGQNIIGTIVPETESSGRNLVEMMRDICDTPAAFINNENENIRKNGERVWISWNNHPLEDSQGTIEGILSVGQDITERKIVEADLQRSELRFRSFVENVNDVLFALTPAGEFSYVSPQWKDSFGYEPAETINRPFPPFVHPDDVPACFAFMHKILETGQKQSGVEFRVLCKNGSYTWYKANASLISDPNSGQPSIVGIGRDISERKLAEETLRQSEEKFSAAFRSSPDAITLSRLNDGVYLEVNDGFTAMTGYLPEEALGRSSVEMNLWVDIDQRTALLKSLKEFGTAKDVEATFKRKDGTLIAGQISARIISIKGEPYVLGVTRDISGREQILQELVKAQKLESISILAGGIAHNFNNVLTGVIGYISYAKKHLSNPEKISHILDSAEKSSYRAAGLARQLLTFSQGSTPVKKTIVVDDLVHESVSLFLSGSNVKGVITCSSRQSIYADSQLINQAFNNIVLNALQAMPEGGTLTVQSTAVTLRSGNKYRLPPASYVRITFEDTGVGIQQKNLEKVFDPYFTTKETGTGLGLSTTHSIISKHGGGIDIASETGKGTCVTVFLPISTETSLSEESTSPSRLKSRKKASILVMDDDEMILDILGDILTDQGYSFTICRNGEEAVELFNKALQARKPYSAVIMDLVVPGSMGGVEAARRILERDPQARLIASSGYPNNPAIAEFASYGFCGTIAKPYNVEELNQTLHAILSGRS